MNQAQTRQERAAFGALLFLLLAHSFYAAFVGNSGVVYLALIAPAFLLGLIYPRVGLLSALVTTIFFERFFTLAPFISGDTVYKLYPLDVMLLASYAGGLLYWIREGTQIRLGAAQIWFLLFLTYVTGLFFVSLSVFTSASAELAFSTWKEYCFYGGIFFLIPFFVREQKDLVVLGKVLFWSAIGALVFLLIGAARGGGLWTEYTPLTTSGIRLVAFPHGFYFALALLGLFLAAPSRFVSPRIAVLLGYGLGLGVIASLMRHIWLGLLATTVVFLAYTWRSVYAQELRRLALLLGAPLLFVALAVWFGFSLFPDSSVARSGSETIGIVGERIQSIGNTYDESFAWRAVVWQETGKAFLKTPLTGMGFGQYVPIEIGDYKEFVEVRDIHNSWLALLVQQGLVGAFLFTGFLCALLWPLYRSLRNHIESSLSLIVVGALLLFQALVFLSQPYLETNLLGIWFWVTLGAAAVLARQIKTSQAL